MCIRLVRGVTEEKGVERVQCEGKLPAPSKLKHLVKNVLISQKVEGLCRQNSLLETKTGMNELLVQTIFAYFYSSHLPQK